MFSAVSIDSTQRLMEAKVFIDICSDSNIKLQKFYDERVLMGNVYVLLYGALEYTITNCVFRTIELLNQEKNLRLYDVLPSLWGLIYSSDCDRIETAGTNKKWENRYKLFSHLTKTEVVQQIEANLFPSSNGNIKEKQLQMVWDTFGLKSPMFEPEHLDVKNDLLTLANGRMAIAHGREKSSVIGGRTTIADLSVLYNSISRYCSYLIECFKKYIKDKEYIQT
ncbi:MAG: hypothetical protein K5757_03745 [Bacteroidaceae bacterium]|nr:hypothetical protein [Bacteroidaceae bacterium]